MVRTYSKFILRTQHSKRFNPANFRFFNLNFFTAHSKFGAKSCQHNLLTRSHIRSTANNLKRLAFTGVNFCYVKVVRIGMCYTLKKKKKTKKKRKEAFRKQ